MSGIEIYVRHQSEGAMLDVHLSSNDRLALIRALTSGSMNDEAVPIHLEL